MGRVRKDVTLISLDFNYFYYLDNDIYDEMEYLHTDGDEGSITLVAASALYYTNLQYTERFNVEVNSSNYYEIITQLTDTLIYYSTELSMNPVGLLYNFLQLQLHINPSQAYFLDSLYITLKNNINLSINHNTLDHTYTKYHFDSNTLINKQLFIT